MTEYKRNITVAYTNIRSPFADGSGTRFQLHLQIGGGATNPVGLSPGDPLRKCKSNPIPPIPGLKRWQTPGPAPPPPPPPPPARMAADKCIAKDKPGC